MKTTKKVCFVLLMCFSCLLVGGALCSNYSRALSKSELSKKIKSQKKTIKKYQKLYNKDAKRVKKENKGIISVPDSYTSVSGYQFNAVKVGKTISLVDTYKKTYYIINGGKSYLSIYKNPDNSYLVTGYVRKTGKGIKSDGWKFIPVKGDLKDSNNYSVDLKNAKKKLKELQKAQSFSFKFDKSISKEVFLVGSTYDLYKYISNSSKYNDIIWDAFDEDFASLDSEGHLTVKQGECFVEIGIRASASEIVTKQEIYLSDSVTIDVKPENSETKVVEVSGDYEINGCHYGEKIKINVSSLSGNIKFDYKSSHPDYFSVDSEGVITILRGSFGFTEEWISKNSHEYYVTALRDGYEVCRFYICAQSIKFSLNAKYYPSGNTNDFKIETVYSADHYSITRLYSGDKVQLLLNPAPSDTVKYEFTCMNSSAVKIDENGLITMPTVDYKNFHTQYDVSIKISGNKSSSVLLDLHFFGQPE